MLVLFTFLHFLGISFLAGGEPLVAMMAIKSEKDDNALKFFISFLWNIVIYMWIGMILALIGGLGMFMLTNSTTSNIFWLKIALYIIVAIVSLLLLVNVPKVKSAAQNDFKNLRQNPIFKRMELLSRIDMIFIFAVLIVSVFL